MKAFTTSEAISASARRLVLCFCLIVSYAVPVLACGSYPWCQCPILSGEVGTMASDGSFRVWVTRTNYENMVCFNVYFNGGSTRYCYGFADLPPGNPTYIDLSAFCMTEPSELRIVPTDCWNAEYTAGQWTTTISPPEVAKPKVSVTIDKAFDPATQQIRNQATVEWEFGAATDGWSVRLDAQPWTTANGVQHAGGPMWNSTSPTRTGTHQVFFDPPDGAQKFPIQATAESCTGTTTDDATAECAPCDGTGSADPVYFNDGNVGVSDGDPLPPIAGLTLSRSYNSDEQVIAPFGRGWTTLFEQRLAVHADGSENVISLTTETNDVVTFRGTSGNYRQTWPKSRTSTGTLLYDAVAGTYTYRAPGSTSVTVFDSTDGTLSEVRDLSTGRAALVTYDSGGCPLALTDSWSGLAWNLTCDPTRRLVTSITVSGRPDLEWTYSYDSARNLESVSAPGPATWRTYEYDDNRLIASKDGLGNLIESHTYDADGYGISSTGPTDEIASIEYGVSSPNPNERITRVTAKNGQITDYVLQPSGGSWRTVEIRGGCSSCGSSDGTLVRDGRGRVVRRQDADGYITETVYSGDHVLSVERPLKPVGCNPETDSQRCRLDSGNLAVAALEPTSASVLTSYEYGDAAWPERTTSVERPSVAESSEVREESYTYHPVTGRVASTTTCGWTPGASVCAERTTQTTFYETGSPGLTPAFDPGGTFQSSWLSLSQPESLPKAVDGPRTDAADVLDMVYYPIDSTVPALLRGRLAATRNPLGQITRHETYDVFGNVTRVVDPNGVATEMTYDALGRLLTSTIKAVSGCNTSLDPLCATDLTSTRSYVSTTGPLHTDQRPSGAVHVYAYDSRGRIQTLSRGPAQNDLRERVETSYDSLTGKKSLEKTLAYVSGSWVEKTRQAYAYDSHARLQTVTHADNTAIHYTYDPADRLATVRDENHSTANTTYAYDPAGRLALVTQALAGAPGGIITTHYGYDGDGNLTSVTDPNGNVTTYVYDDFGQMAEQDSPVTGVTTYEYDVAGQLVVSTDANGASTARTYDAAGRTVTASSTRSGRDPEQVVSTYDNDVCGAGNGIGRLSSMNDPMGETIYCYERRGLLASRTDVLGCTTSFRYDVDGNRQSMTYPSGLSVDYTFDYAGRPLSATAGVTPLVSAATYLPFGPVTQIAFGNGTTRTSTYDTRYRPLRNWLTGPSGIIADYHYTVDPVGNITEIEDALDSSYDREFGYDDLNRLTTANSGTSLWGTGAYTYDPMGNLTSSQLGSNVVNFTHLGTTAKLDEVNGVPVAYDDAGNEVSGNREYSARNLLSSIDRPTSGIGSWIAYGYDGRGVRVYAYWSGKSVDFQLGDYGQYFIYTPELKLMAKSDWAPASITGVLMGTEYIWFGNTPVAQIATDPNIPIRYTFTDHLDTPLLQTNSAASVVWRVEYEPYGAIFDYRAGTDDSQVLRFPGQETDDYRSDLNPPPFYYNIFRWYRAGWGRYTQSDPIGLEGGDNLYQYALSNPVSNIDPKGLLPFAKQTDCPCMNCPTGLWYQFGGTLSGMFKFVGGGGSLYRFRCPSGRLQCDYLTVCGKGGVGLFGGLVGGGGSTLFAYCPEELDGWSFNVDFDVPGGSGNAGPGTAGTLGVTIEGGVQTGAGGGINLCYSFRLGCKKY